MAEKKSSKNSFTEILNIDITGNCEFGLQGDCVKLGQWCQEETEFHPTKSHDNCPNMTIDNFKSIIDQCKDQQVKIQLGGYTDPDNYYGIEELLQYCKDNDIVPDIITTGFGLTPKMANLLKECCSVVTVLWRNSSNTYQALRMLLDAEVKTNLCCPVNSDTIKDLNIRLELNGHDFPEGIDTIIFVPQEPLGVVSKDKILLYDDPNIKKFFNLLNSGEFKFKIRIASCFAPDVVELIDDKNHLKVDECIAGNQSAYISADMKMMPCRIGCAESKWAVDLTTCSISEAWQSKEFEDFNSCFDREVSDTSIYKYCTAPCPCNVCLFENSVE